MGGSVAILDQRKSKGKEERERGRERAVSYSPFVYIETKKKTRNSTFFTSKNTNERLGMLLKS